MNSNKFPRPAPLSPSAPSAPPPTAGQIAALAHAIWLDRGCPLGRDLDHWLEAERQLRGGAAPAAVDADLSDQATIERELDRVVAAPAPRSPTSL